MCKACPAEAGGGDLAGDLAQMMVHREGIADRHNQRRRFALRRADRTKQIGRQQNRPTEIAMSEYSFVAGWCGVFDSGDDTPALFPRLGS